ncbi:hypothetical protein GCM10010911_60330 [Paenibacillus nasutitermitis]|uniref:Uncharacterized protein n=1 Tax=Paenibacillus nasutitermitis TaxID=1652958 RepID=A0A917E2B1_9BACL|nr:hypothetical protein GCM10010911_60330 [Paenibacillus nasutitermitis]
MLLPGETGAKNKLDKNVSNDLLYRKSCAIIRIFLNKEPSFTY